MAAILAAIHATVSATVSAALAPYAVKIDALEKASMPPPAPRVPVVRAPPRHNRVDDPPPETSTSRTRAQPPPAAIPATDEGEFTLVTRKGGGKKGKGKANANNVAPAGPQQPGFHSLTPASYAGTAASAANTKQPTALPKKAARAPIITEITVLRPGGHPDPIIEEGISMRPADQIVRQVKAIMAKVVANPIPLKAGRWSMHPRSKGNFVYSFDGNVPFNIIQTYERILLHPFQGTGQLSPSMGWTRLLAHGVPVWDEYGEAFPPEMLLAEVKAIPGLKKAHFAMAPRWLKPIGAIDWEYSTLTFAISDPGGAITESLLLGRAAIFGKEIVLKRWVDKPVLIQCSHCHRLGHSKVSKACRLSKDSVMCHICGGAHKSEQHNQRCPRIHAVAGICDCTHFKCINCMKTGHDCRNKLCPARDNFRPRAGHKPRRPRGNGRTRDAAMEDAPAEEPFAEAARVEEAPLDLDDDDLYAVPPPPFTPPVFQPMPRARIILPDTTPDNPPPTQRRR